MIPVGAEQPDDLRTDPVGPIRTETSQHRHDPSEPPERRCTLRAMVDVVGDTLLLLRVQVAIEKRRQARPREPVVQPRTNPSTRHQHSDRWTRRAPERFAVAAFLPQPRLHPLGSGS
jgi:hypothetical protein